MYPQLNPFGNAIDRSLARSLPLLPGNTFNFNVGADRFHRSQHWEIKDGLSALADRDWIRNKPAIGGTEQPPWALEKMPIDCSPYPKGHGPVVPQFVKFDKKVLSFNAYYQEPIPESSSENYRIHQCKIFYYLEDDTVQVVEPKTYNAGLPQGSLISRHKIPFDPPCQDEFFNVQHFNVGCEVIMYRKTFFICSCDGFTRDFLNRLGIRVPDNMELPEDVATEKEKDKKRSQFARKPHQCMDTRGSFILHDRHVLRFWAYWDDRCNLYGDLREFVLHYYLGDNTIEIREIVKPNSGYDSFPCFLRRGKLLKDPAKLVPLPGVETPQTILNVFGSIYATRNKKAHYIVDNLGLGARDVEYYTDKDLAIGAVISALGRAFTLARCDKFTQQYYRERYGIEDFTPLELTKEELPEEPKKPEIPPYTGWGTEEDSLGSWKSLELRPHVRDMRKFAEMDKDVLRFQAKFYKPLQRVNQDRRFFVYYYMADDTTAVYEKVHPNTGLPRGGFLFRGRFKKPGWQPELGDAGDYYEPKDYFVGNILKINSFDFQLIEADEFTLCYMERNKDQFPAADICICLNKIREAFGPLQAEDVLKCFSENDTGLQGVLDIGNFRTLLLQISKCGLSEHEIQTLARAYAAKAPPPGVDWETLQAIVQTELRKFIYDKYLLERIEYSFRHLDPCRSGNLDRETLRATLKGAKLPLDRTILDFIVDKFPAGDDCNRVPYCELLKFLDWEDNPAPTAKPAAIKCIMEWIFPQHPLNIFCVNYRAFLEDVCPNIICALPAVVCCCHTRKPCPKHPQPCRSQAISEDKGYCPVEVKKAQEDIPDCPPQEPLNVYLKPCFTKPIQGMGHKCAPGSKKCFADAYEDEQPQEGGLPQIDLGEDCGNKYSK